jgi:ATP-dependent exoDNAse (exonuclease V) alpha subunit
MLSMNSIPIKTGEVNTPDIKSAIVSGRIIEVVRPKKIDGKWDDPIFTILTLKSKTVFRATCRTFCRVMGGDVIEARGNITPSMEKEYDYILSITETPIIEPGIDEGTIRSVITRVFPRLGAMAQDDISRIYKKLARVTGDIEDYQGMSPPNRINLYLNRLSIEYHRSPQESDAHEKFFPEMDKTNAQKLLRDWYSKRIVRQLQMLGLTNDEIKHADCELDILHSKLKGNPYTIPFVSLERCNTLCQRFRITPTDDQIKKGEILRMVYNNAVKNAWSATPIYFLQKRFEDLDKYLPDLLAETDCEANTPRGYGLIKTTAGQRVMIMLHQCYNAEMIVHDHLVKIINGREDKDKRYFEPNYRMETLTSDQKCAIKGALNNAVSVITGGGGSGKTTSIIEIVLNLEQRKMNFVIVSFTGKAVVRAKQVLRQAELSETMVETAYTIHRSIYKGVHMDEDQITHLIIDETSMVTTELLSKFLSKFVNVRWICCIGDCNQLLPITWGSFFTEIISSERVPVYYLTHCHRTYKFAGQENGILYNCNAIANHCNDLPFRFKPFENFVLYQGNEKTVKMLINSFKEANIPDAKLTVVTPYNIIRKSINRYYQERYRTEEDNICDFLDNTKNIWKKYDKVVAQKNNYDIDVMNGEEGRVLDVNAKYATVTFDMDAVVEVDMNKIKDGRFSRTHNFKMYIPQDDEYGGDAKWGSSMGKEEHTGSINVGMLSHGYCLTGHKSQGSEYEYLIVYIPQDKKPSKSFLCRNLLYVMLSRGKIGLYLVGDIPTIEKIVTTLPAKRYECLGEWLSTSLEKTTDGIDRRENIIGTICEEDKDAMAYFQGDDDDFDDDFD